MASTKNKSVPTYLGNYSDMVGALKSGEISSSCFMFLEDRKQFVVIHWEKNAQGKRVLVPHIIDSATKMFTTLNSSTDIMFGYFTTDEINQALQEKTVSPYDVLYNRDTGEQFIVNQDYKLFSVSSRMKIFNSLEHAIESVRSDSSIHAGEIISVYSDNRFRAYVVQEDRTIYVAENLSYNDLSNLPIKNVGLTASDRVNILSLSDGYYKVNYFISPAGNEIDSIVGNVFIIHTNGNNKTIKRISNDSIYDYYIDEEGNVTDKKYVTEDYIKSKGYTDSEELDAKLLVVKEDLNDSVKSYIDEHIGELVQNAVSEKFSNLECSEQDILNLFNMEEEK